MKPYSNIFTDPDDPPRNLTAAALGIGQAIGGDMVPVAGLGVGLLAQVVEGYSPGLKRAQYITEGIVDGSAALLARRLLRGSTRPHLLIAANDASPATRAKADYVCRGVNDDEPFDLALARNTVVDVSPGRYWFSRSLRPRSGMDLRGQAGDTVINLWGARSFVESLGAFKARLHDVNIEGFEVNGQGAPVAGAIALYNVDRLRTADCFVHDVNNPSPDGGYGFYFQDCTDLWLTRIWASNIAQRDGIQLKGCTNVWMDEPLVDHTGLRGIDVHTSVTWGVPTNIRIIRPRIQAAGTEGIFVSGIGITVDSPTISNCPVGVSLATDIQQGSIGTLSHGHHLISPQISNCTRAIWIGNGYELFDVLVDGQGLINGGDIALLVAASGVVSAYKGIFDALVSGLRVQGGGRIVLGGNGIASTLPAHWVKLQRCSVSGARGSAILLAPGAQQYEVAMCRVNASSGYGIEEAPGADYNRLLNNVLSNNARGPMLVSGKHTLVE